MEKTDTLVVVDGDVLEPDAIDIMDALVDLADRGVVVIANGRVAPTGVDFTEAAYADVCNAKH